jgi:DNA-binding NarL/FixJ family response regulator
VKLPLPPGCLPTLWNADQRFRDAYLTEFPGFYKTADAGFIDEDGWLYFVERIKDSIRRRGQNISAYEVECLVEEHEDVLEALRAGARGYVVKASAQEEIVAAILATARGEAWLSPKVAGRLVDEFRHLPAVTLEETLREESHLTPREQMVLARLAQGMTNREIAEALAIAETTVKTHLQHILDKLHARNRLEAASFALKLGLIDGGGPGSSLSG